MPAWTHRILLNAVDITAQTLLGATVDEGENVSSVADITWLPPSGAQDSDALLLQTLAIDVDVGAGWTTLFSGRVMRSRWDTQNRSYAIRASNRLQEHFRAMGSHAAVLTALPGAVYSDALFGEPPDDLWEYAQICMQTIEQDVHLYRGGTLALVDWLAKGTSDVVLQGDDIHNQGAFRLSRADADETINRVVIEYGYRVERWKTRTHTLAWDAWNNNTPIDSWCDWVIGALTAYQFNLPTVNLVRSTMEGASWFVANGISYTTHPASGSNLCGTQGWVWINSDGTLETALTAAAEGYRAWGQPITEIYTLTVDAANSQSHYGATVTDRKTGSLDVESDSTWPPQNAQPQPGWSVDAIGDSYEDQQDENARTNDLQAGYQWAGWRIRGAHRATSLLVRMDIDPNMSLSITASVTSYGLHAKGKIRRLLFVLDAAPYLDITLAISRGSGGTTDAWAVPSRPDTTDPGYPAPPATTTLQTHVGWFTGAPPIPVPDDRLGWVTNVGEPHSDPGADRYDLEFRAEWPAVEDEAAQERTESALSSWELWVPQDTLDIT